MSKIRMKRERDIEKATRMERLDARRNNWEIINICSSIMKELVDGMEPFMTEGWRKEVETHLLTLGLDEDRYARNAKVMEEDEEWLVETSGRMMEDRSVSCSMESLDREVCAMMTSTRMGSLWSTTSWSGWCLN